MPNTIDQWISDISRRLAMSERENKRLSQELRELKSNADATSKAPVAGAISPGSTLAQTLDIGIFKITGKVEDKECQYKARRQISIDFGAWDNLGSDELEYIIYSMTMLTANSIVTARFDGLTSDDKPIYTVYATNDFVMVTCAEDIPAKSLAYLSAYSTNTNVYTVLKPKYYSMITSRLVITQNEIKANEIGVAFYNGKHYVKASTASGVFVGNFACTNQNEWDAYPGGAQGFTIIQVDTDNGLFLVDMDKQCQPVLLNIYENADSNGYYKARPMFQTANDPSISNLIYKVKYLNIDGNLPEVGNSYFQPRYIEAVPCGIEQGYITCYALSNLPFTIFIE